MMGWRENGRKRGRGTECGGWDRREKENDQMKARDKGVKETESKTSLL